jgi:hemoglobin
LTFVHLETHGSSLYERVGGQAFFDALVEHFYAGVATDPLLRPLYPDDLEPPKRRLALFLAQYWGGPQTYSAERGHPRLRMRHMRFRIGPLQREAWLGHMRAALEANSSAQAISPTADDRAALMAYFETAATSLLNTPR